MQLATHAGSAHTVVALVLLALARPPAHADASGVIERIEIAGNTHTRDKTIRRALAIREADPIEPGQLEVARRRVAALGFFFAVTISTRPGTGPGLVRIDVHVIERPAIGSGFSSAENFIAIVQMRQVSIVPIDVTP